MRGTKGFGYLLLAGKFVSAIGVSRLKAFLKVYQLVFEEASINAHTMFLYIPV